MFFAKTIVALAVTAASLVAAEQHTVQFTNKYVGLHVAVLISDQLTRF